MAVEAGDIFGDGVNIAARFEGLAELGGICVSARVQEDAATGADARCRMPLILSGQVASCDSHPTANP